MLKFLRLFYAVCFSLGLLAGNHFVCSEEERIETFREEAPIAWQKYLDFFTNVEVSRYLETIEDNVTESRSSNDIYHLGSNHLSIKHTDGVNTVVSGNNKKYRFTLTSKDGESWCIYDVQKIFLDHSDSVRFPELGNQINKESVQDIASWNTSHLAMALKVGFFIWLPQYINNNDFEIHEVENLYQDDLHLLRIKYKFEPKEFDARVPLRSGEIFLLPDYGWVVKKARYEAIQPDGETRVHCDWNIDYDFSLSDVALPLVVTDSVNDPTQEPHSFTQKWFYEWKGPCTLDEKAFTLSHFGLSEPDFDESHPNRIRFILVVLGIFMILSATYRIYQKRKNKKGSTGP